MSCEQPLSVLICRVQVEELIEKREEEEHLIRVGHGIIRNVSLTERYRRSAIPDMQRKLNQSLMEQRKLMNDIVTSEL